MSKIKFIIVLYSLTILSSCFYSDNDCESIKKFKLTENIYWFYIKNEKGESIGDITNFYKHEMEAIFDAGFCNLSIKSIDSVRNSIVLKLKFSKQTPDMKKPKIEYYKCYIEKEIINDIICNKIDSNAPRSLNCQNYTIQAKRILF